MEIETVCRSHKFLCLWNSTTRETTINRRNLSVIPRVTFGMTPTCIGFTPKEYIGVVSSRVTNKEFLKDVILLHMAGMVDMRRRTLQINYFSYKRLGQRQTGLIPRGID